MTTTPAILHLSLVVSGDLVDADGRRLGKIEDLLAHLGDDEYPPVSGAVVKMAGRNVYIPAKSA